MKISKNHQVRVTICQQCPGLIHYSTNHYDATIRKDTSHNIPNIVSGNVNISARIGDTVTLPCEVEHLGHHHHVNWLKIEKDTPITLTVGYHQFSRNMRYRVARLHNKNEQNKVESWSFEIRKVVPEDQGLYQCYIKINPKQKVKANINLIVKSETGMLIKKHM